MNQAQTWPQAPRVVSVLARVKVGPGALPFAETLLAEASLLFHRRGRVVYQERSPGGMSISAVTQPENAELPGLRP